MWRYNFRPGFGTILPHLQAQTNFLLPRLIRILHYLCAQNNILHEHSITYRRTSPHPVRCKRLDRRAASVAKRFRIPNIVIGLTIVVLWRHQLRVDLVGVSSALKERRYFAIGSDGGQQYLQHTWWLWRRTEISSSIAVTRNTLLVNAVWCIHVFH